MEQIYSNEMLELVLSDNTRPSAQTDVGHIFGELKAADESMWAQQDSLRISARLLKSQLRQDICPYMKPCLCLKTEN